MNFIKVLDFNILILKNTKNLQKINKESIVRNRMSSKKNIGFGGKLRKVGKDAEIIRLLTFFQPSKVNFE